MNDSSVKQPNKLLNILKKTFFTLIILFLTIFLIIWIFSPALIKWQTNKQLENYNLVLSDDSSVRINPFLLKTSINDISLLNKKNQKKVAHINNAEIDIKLLPLFSNTLDIEQFTFKNLELSIIRNTNGIRIAGFELPNEETKTETKPAAEEKLAWQVIGEKLSVESLTTKINNFDQKHEIILDNLTLSQLSANEEKQKLNLNLQANIDKAPLTLKANITNDKNTQVKLSLLLKEFQTEKIHYLIENELKDLTGSIDLSLNSLIEINQEKTDINIDKLRLATKNIDLKNLDFNIKNQQSIIETSNTQIVLSNNNLNQLNSLYQVKSEDLLVSNAKNNDVLVSYKQLNLNQGKLSIDKQQPKINIDSIIFDQVIVSSVNKEKTPALSTLKKIIIDKISFENNTATIDTLSLSNLNANVILDKDKNLANLFLLDKKESKQQASENTEKEKSNITFHLKKFNISEESQFTFNDQSIKPNFLQTIQFEKFNVSNIDSKNPETQTTFDITFKTDSYSKGSITGSAQPFLDKMNVNIQSNITEFSLPKVSPYLRENMGFEMLSGQFDTDLKIDIKDDNIDGNTQLKMRGLELSTSDSKSSNPLKSQGAMPLNSALNMLKDSKGNLELDIPLSGDVSKPGFGVTSFITLITKKAIMSAAESYLIDAFVPYANVLSVVMVAGEYLLKIEVEDLNYTNAQIEPDESQNKFIDEFVALMQKEKDTQIKICAIATIDDLNDKNIKNTKEIKLSEEQNNQLLKISQQRGEKFKAVIVNKGKIESTRLLLCKPQIDKVAKSKPRIEFEI